MEVIRRRNNNCVGTLLLEQLLDVCEYVWNAQPLRKRARFHSIVIANGNKAGSLDLCQYGQMRELRDGTGADECQPHFRWSTSIYIDLLAARRSPGALRGQSMRPTVVPG